MDGHGVLALVAPRACALADGWTDREGDLTFADEAAVRAAQGVYALLGAPVNLTLMCAPHCHPSRARVRPALPPPHGVCAPHEHPSRTRGGVRPPRTTRPALPARPPAPRAAAPVRGAALTPPLRSHRPGINTPPCAATAPATTTASTQSTHTSTSSTRASAASTGASPSGTRARPSRPPTPSRCRT